jgi:hypothetical protein
VMTFANMPEKMTPLQILPLVSYFIMAPLRPYYIYCNYSAPCSDMPVAAQIALDLFENKENTRSVLLHSSMFDAVIGQIKGDLSSYHLFCKMPDIAQQ